MKQMSDDGEEIMSCEEALARKERFMEQTTQAYTDEMILQRQKRLGEVGEGVVKVTAKLKLEAEIADFDTKLDGVEQRLKAARRESEVKAEGGGSGEPQLCPEPAPSPSPVSLGGDVGRGSATFPEGDRLGADAPPVYVISPQGRWRRPRRNCGACARSGRRPSGSCRLCRSRTSPRRRGSNPSST
jgi:hypothetical protein